MKVVVISAHTGSLLWFRLDMLREFVAHGHDVVAVGPDAEAGETRPLTDAGVTYRELSVSRNGLNPLSDLRYFVQLVRLLREERPDCIFLYQAKPIAYGALAARLAGIDRVFPLVAGLGSIFRGESFKSRVLRRVLLGQYWLAMRLSEAVFFQNPDDRSEFTRRGLVNEHKTVMLSGSGVNLEQFALAPLPDTPAILFVGRLIGDKGVREYLIAARQLRLRHPELDCLLVGPFDSNPSSLSAEELEPFVAAGDVIYAGEQRDVRPFLERSSIFVLPSYHEGTPKSVLEAMAVGRPVVTTDAPGCRETVVDGLNGYLVPVRDHQGLTEAIDRILMSPDGGQRMAAESRRIAETKFDVRRVNRVIMETMGLASAAERTETT